MLPSESIYADMYGHLADCQRAPRGREPGFSWASSPHRIWGAACYGIDIAEGDGEGRLDGLARKLRALGCVALVSPSSERALEAAGFKRVREASGMSVPRDGFRPVPAPAGLRIKTVSSNAEWSAWSAVLCPNLFGSSQEADIAGFAAMGAALAGGGRAEAFLGYDASGRAVATSAAYTHQDALGGVFFVSTEADARRRGYGAALTSAATASCFDSGAELAALSATDSGRPVYESLGYRIEAVMKRFGPPE